MNENGCDIQMKQRGNGKNSILCLHESSHTRGSEMRSLTLFSRLKNIYLYSSSFFLAMIRRFVWLDVGGQLCMT